jgi:hypothetical protein
VVAGFVGCYALLKSGRPYPAGAVLALALVKPHLAGGVVLFLFVHRQWRTIGAFCAVGLPLFVAPGLLLGRNLLVDQVRLLFSFVGSTGEHGVNARMMINVRGTVTSLTDSSDVWLWLPLLAIIALAALLVTTHLWTERPVLDGQSWALAFALPLLYSPHLHAQSLVLLFAATALYLSADRGRSISATHMLAGLIMLLSLWLVSLAGLALTSLAVLAAFWYLVRRWPGRYRLPDTRVTVTAAT